MIIWKNFSCWWVVGYTGGMKQGQALGVMDEGGSVFLTGAPGAGKTYVLNQFVRRAKKQGRRVAVTASTGIAATHIGGSTIHSWSGLGIRDSLTGNDEQWLKNNSRLVKRYNETDVLVIDEVSMLHGARLDMINQACKLLRGGDKPFGGLQVILVGDLFQLPPVTRGSSQFDFAHTSGAWQELEPQICYLSEQHRQTGDELLQILEAMRGQDVSDAHEEILSGRIGTKPHEGQQITRLYAHNIDVESLNQTHLARLSTDSKTYQMEFGGAKAKVEQLAKGILAPEVLELKVGAEVMFVANNPSKGFYNGSRGQVIGFTADDKPRVKLATGSRIIAVEPHSWTLEEDGKRRAEVTQLPLRLAWAITIHKSQGMSLDAAEVDLSKSFTPGMGYVALSRIRSLDGLYLTGINRMAMQLNPHIFEFDVWLRAASAELAARTPELIEDVVEAEKPETPKANIDDELLTKLKAWRLNRASADKVPAYIIAHNAFLEEIAQRKPANAQQLLAVKGCGPRKVEVYGDDILQVLAAHGVKLQGEGTSEDMKNEIRNMKNGEDTKGGVKNGEDIDVHGEDERPTDSQLKRQATIAEYPRAFQRWQPEEDAQLMQLFQDKTYLGEACKIMQRQPAALWARLSQLLNSVIM